MNRKERTITRSFRLNEAAFSALEQDAKRQNVSVNTLVNQLLLSYANFDRLAREFHMIKISPATFSRILQAAPDELVSGAGHWAGSEIYKTFILAKEGTLSLEGVLEYLRAASDYANLFEYNEVVHEGTRTITLVHDLGKKGSLFLEHYVQAIFEGTGVKPRPSTGDRAVVFRL